MKIEEFTERTEALIAAARSADRKPPSISKLLKGRSDDYSRVLEVLTQYYRRSRQLARNPSLARVLSMASKLTASDYCRIVYDADASNHDASLSDTIVDAYVKRFKSSFDGDEAFKDVMDDMREDPQVRLPETVQIAEAIVGYKLGRISKKRAQSVLLDEYSKIGVGQIAADAARRSKLF